MNSGKNSINLININSMDMNDSANNAEFYKLIRQNRFVMYAKPRRYYNRDGESGNAFKFLFLMYAVVFMIAMLTVSVAFGQRVYSENPGVTSSSSSTGTITKYTTIYNSGKVFLNWTARNEPADCIYIIERSQDGNDYTSIGVKEGIGTEIELFYSWMDETPPEGFAYYRVKKITRDGMQFYSAANAVINMDASYNPKMNYAKGKTESKTGQ
ncbi:MAG: hypothetical protein IT241_06095 [Bacteroidia bacterium]|nr:hypothetical protein [Bacteroidia bacterium]